MVLDIMFTCCHFGQHVDIIAFGTFVKIQILTYAESTINGDFVHH